VSVRRGSGEKLGRAPGRSASEWVCLRFPAPFLLGAPGADSRPDLVLWLALPEDQIFAHDLASPGDRADGAEGRAELDLLLRHFENNESRVEGKNAFDFSSLRRQLGLP
jgi:hypothetical protein